ncbi:MAG TPA: hypothetical protein VFI65_12720 [Streptosporangiaceae bacterium]|nr:hypothetical protein [Streptosporangiaceae bacterium]
MEMMQMTVSYLAGRARRLGRTIFGNDAGALTLEWIVIAGLLVVATGIAIQLFESAIRSQATKMNK